MSIRKPIVASQFYPGSEAAARQAVDECLSVNVDEKELPATIVGGIVPHAGWVCSGMVAGRVFKAIHLRQSVDTFVLFGAVHRIGGSGAAIYSTGGWETPLGVAAVDEDLASAVLRTESNLVQAMPRAHEYEHSIEVQVPFIQRLFPGAKILPVMVPPTKYAGNVGRMVARAVRARGTKAVCLGSSDLTHYGPSYRLTGKGLGPAGVRWARDVNDKGLLELIERMDGEGALDYAEATQSACGAGAIAAAIGAAKELGADTVKILEHTTSYEVLSKRFGDRGNDSVGYAGIVFGMK